MSKKWKKTARARDMAEQPPGKLAPDDKARLIRQAVEVVESDKEHENEPHTYSERFLRQLD